VADISVIGRPAILIPLASAIRDEQTANARGLVEAGAAVVLPESRLSSETLAEEITAILSDSDAALQMSLAALRVGRPDAAERLAGLVLELAGMDAGMDAEMDSVPQEDEDQ